MRLKLLFSLLIVALLWSASSVWAGVYKWRDNAGKLHFTDDKSKIPPQYRSPSGAMKMKGMIEPPAPKKPEPPAEEVKDPSAVENPDEMAGTEPSPAEVKKDPTADMDPKLVAMLKETKGFLEIENKQYQFMFDSVNSNETSNKSYLIRVKRFLRIKEGLLKKLRRFKQPSLKAAQKFLQISARIDKRFKLGGEDIEKNMVRLKKRLKKDIETKKKLIVKLKADLGEPMATASIPPQ